MQTWSIVHGLPWACVPSDGPVLAGLMLGWGHAHQTVAQLGIAGALAEVLRRELARPVESGDAGVVQTAVAVNVGPQDTSITVASDDPEAVRRQLVRLDALLSDPTPADLSGVGAGRRDQPIDGWLNELTAWWGLGSAALSYELNPRWAGSDAALRESLGALHPRRGVAAVAFASDPALVGAALATGDSADRPAAPTELGAGVSWRAAGPASITPTFANNLLTARADTSPAGAAAERVLVATVHRTLMLSDGGQRLISGWLPVDRFGLLTLRAEGYDGYDAAAVHAATVLAIDTCRDLGDEALQEQIDAGRQPEQLSIAMDVRVLAAHALRTGERRSADDVRTDLGTLGVPAVREALAQLLDRVVLGRPAETDAPAGFPLRTVEPALDPEAGRLRNYASNFAVPVRNGSPRSYKVSHQGNAITVATRGPGHGQQPAGSQTLDLRRVVARIDWGQPGISVLVDDENRQVVLPWGALKNSRRLRSDIDAAVPSDRRLVLAADAGYEEALRRRRRFERRVLIGVGTFLGLVAALILAVNLAIPDDQPTTAARVDIGTAVALANGTTVAVANPRSTTLANVRREFLLADVTFCGGGPTYDDGESVARNSVSREDFYLDNQIAVEPLLASYSSDHPWLQSIAVTQGQCVTATIGYGVPARAPGGSTIRYGNAVGDVVDWAF